MNPEDENHKVGLIGELFVRIKLNEIKINTGSVDKDTGTDIVAFFNGKSKTVQVKTGKNRFYYGVTRDVDLLICVKLAWNENGLSLDNTKFKFKCLPHGRFKENLMDLLQTFNEHESIR